jgi:hypothetical protein
MQSEDVESWFRGKPILPTQTSEPANQHEDMHTQVACLSRAALESLVLALADKLPEVRCALAETYENSLETEPKKRPKSQMTAEALEALCAKYQR